MKVGVIVGVGVGVRVGVGVKVLVGVNVFVGVKVKVGVEQMKVTAVWFDWKTPALVPREFWPVKAPILVAPAAWAQFATPFHSMVPEAS